MESKIRPARMAAMYVERGDILVTAPAECQVIGTVLTARGEGMDGRSFLIRTPSGAVTEWPETRSGTVPFGRPMWVHVERGRVA